MTRPAQETQETQTAPAHSTDQEPALSAQVVEPTYVVEGEWLVEVVNQHTCGTSPDGYYGAHEPGCGMVPIAKVADLLNASEALARVQRLRDSWQHLNEHYGRDIIAKMMTTELDETING